MPLFSRIVLFVSGLLFAVYGLYCFADIQYVAEALSMKRLSPVTNTEFLAMYGGLQTGLGLLMAYTGLDLEDSKFDRITGLYILLIVVGCLGFARLMGVMMNGSDDYNLSAVIYELVSAAIVFVALFLENKASKENSTPATT